ncbi:hypothetical protein A4A58_19310 [Tardiphaga robiniae]|uniref:Uncharacterized protein n=1 Tax=Tardiphaga robiniae TaxID=943830 RepID=A0A163X400_9BRAD|nr:hypothetical protein A4A58_19310 [Tardiphaga robiniae]
MFRLPIPTLIEIVAARTAARHEGAVMPARTLPPSLSRPARDMDIRYGDVDVGTIAQQDWNANPKRSGI